MQGQRRTSSQSSVQREEVKIENQDLLQILKNLRLDLAKEKNVPAFVIFQIERCTRWLMLSQQVDKTFLTLVVLVKKNWTNILLLFLKRSSPI